MFCFELFYTRLTKHVQTTKYFRRIRTQTFSTLIEYTPGKEFDSSCLLVCFDYLISFRVRQGQLINSFNPISSILSLTEIWTIEFYKNKKLNDCRTLPSGSSSFTTSISSFSLSILYCVVQISFYTKAVVITHSLWSILT